VILIPIESGILCACILVKSRRLEIPTHDIVKRHIITSNNWTIQVFWILFIFHHARSHPSRIKSHARALLKQKGEDYTVLFVYLASMVARLVDAGCLYTT
jgi:hypothetical protein